jgi:catechol 2,3-dioxygenase-like lactoylglutathione lyase family enzyme
VSIESINAITLATQDMRRAVAFYQALQFELIYGGAESSFSSLRAGIRFVNLTRERQASRRTPNPEMPSGVNVTSISLTLMATS